MTTKRNPKIEQYRNLKLFIKLNGRNNQSQRITKRKKFEPLKLIETLSKRD